MALAMIGEHGPEAIIPLRLATPEAYRCGFCGVVYVVPSLARWCENRCLMAGEEIVEG